jgi:hypothetical protein
MIINLMRLLRSARNDIPYVNLLKLLTIDAEFRDFLLIVIYDLRMFGLRINLFLGLTACQPIIRR